MKRSSTAREGNGSQAIVLPLEQWLPYRCSVIANVVSLRLARFYHAKFGLTVHAWRMMAVLGRTAPLSAIELARRTAMDQVSVTRALNHLAALGMVIRGTDASDRRRAAVRLNALGRRTYEAIVPLALELETALVAGLTEAERAALDLLTARVQQNADSLWKEVGNEAGAQFEAEISPPKSRIKRRTTRIPRTHVF